MKAQTGMTLQEAARATGTAKSSLQFRWLDAPRSIRTARTGRAAGFESPVAAGTKADALDHGGMGGDEVLQQVPAGDSGGTEGIYESPPGRLVAGQLPKHVTELMKATDRSQYAAADDH